MQYTKLWLTKWLSSMFMQEIMYWWKSETSRISIQTETFVHNIDILSIPFDYQAMIWSMCMC